MPEKVYNMLLGGLLLAALLFATPATAEIGTEIILDRSISTYILSDRMEILEDPYQSFKVYEIVNGPHQSEFKTFTSGSPNFGRTDSAFWFRTLLVNPYPHPMHLVLEQPLPYIDSMDIYTPDPGKPGEFRLSHAGDRQPFYEREGTHFGFLFHLTLAPEEKMPIHIRVASRAALITPFTFWLAPAWDEHIQSLNAAYGLFFGILLVLTLLSLSLYLFLRDTTYLLFSLFVFCVALMVATSNGLSFKYLWPDSPWLAERMQLVSISLVMLTGTAYARNFLNTRTLLPRMDQWLRGFLYLMTVIVGLSFALTDVVTLALVTLVLIQIYSPLLLLTGLQALKQGNLSARFYLLAWSSSLIGASIASLTLLGVLPYHFILLNATSFGFLLDVTLLSVAMADKIHTIRAERDRANERAHNSLLEASKHLEAEVEHRTRELNMVRHDADSANQAKTQFLANISHEFRTPLTSIIGFSELLLNGSNGSLKEKQKLNLKLIHDSGMHLNALISDLLDVSVIEAGKLKISMSPMPFRMVLDEVLALFEALAAEKQIRIVDTTTEDLPYFVVADRVRLRQVITNLLTNAIKYSPENSDVWVSLKRRDGKVRFSVIDAGPGIAPSDLEKIFTPFTRVREVAEKVDGIGIGLSITKLLINLMAGEISVESRIGRGSRFHIDLVETVDQTEVQNCPPELVPEKKPPSSALNKKKNSDSPV